MSEQALRPAASGTRSASAGSVSGTFPALAGGKVSADTGKSLPQAPAEKADLARLATELNAVSRSIGRDLRFQVDMDLGYAVIQVLDSETGELIRQIPQEKAAISLSSSGALQLRLFDDLV